MIDQMREQWLNKRLPAVLLVIGVLLAAVLMFSAEWEADRQERVRMEAFRGDVADMAQISESIIADRLSKYDQSLLVLRAAYLAGPEHLAENIRLLRSGPLADRELLVVLVDREGFLAYTDAPDVKTPLYLGDRKYFRYFADGGRDRLYIDEPSFGRVTKRYILPLSRPIYDRRGSFLGVIAISVKQDSLGKFGHRLQLSDDTTITVVNHNGAVISRSRNFDKVQGTKLPTDHLAPMLKGAEGVFQGRADPDDVERIIAYRHIDDANSELIVYAEASPGKVLREMSQQRSVLMWIAGFTSLIIMFLIVVYLKGRKITGLLIETLCKSREQEYETLTGTSLDGFYISDGTDRILDSNETFRAMLGYTQEELAQLTLADIESAEAPDQIASHVRSVRETGSARFQTGYRRKDGALLDVEISAQSVSETDGRLFIFVHDITERKQSEKQLTNLSQRLLLATTSARLGVWDWNVRDNHMIWDDRMFELYGIERETFPDSIDAWMNGLHEDDKESALAACQAALDGTHEFNTAFRVRHPDGSVKHIKANGLVIRGADGAAERMLGINYDITEMKRTENENAKLEAQLHQAQKMESVGRLAGGVAHDFNNMLCVIIGHAYLLLQEAGPTHPFRSSLDEICKAAERSADLTRQLLAFARKQTIAPKVLDLNETVSGMLKMLQRLIGEDIHLTWQPAPNLWQINVDPSQIDQIFANLCVNARDAIADIGKITIETGNSVIDDDYCANHAGFVPGEYVRLAVSDDGCGMDKETLPHIFEPFFSTKGVGEGTGLGLATVYGIVKQNNGFINVYSEPGLGTTITIYLPRHLGKTTQILMERAAERPLRGQETILLVEDEPAILNIAMMILTRQGYNVLTANSPAEAIRLAKELTNEIHLLITDVVMPEMNGRDLAKQLQCHYPQISILFMSGYTANVIAHHGVLDEGVHFIQKPFSLPDLATKVREALEFEKIKVQF